MAYLIFAHIDDPDGIHLCGTSEHAGTTLRVDVNSYPPDWPETEEKVRWWLDQLFQRAHNERMMAGGSA